MDRLEHYKTKRDFSLTPEPRGKSTREQKNKALLFVVQKHDARRLHYDFRLEWNGVLKSWAIPKGPSLDPTERRLAVRTEDHPLDYRNFEGIIPQGQYGGGRVLIWDQGYWVPEGDPERELKKGSLHFYLVGQRLRGKFILTRFLKQKNREQNKENWLLIKRSDEDAEAGSGDKIIRDNSTSIISGLDLSGMEQRRLKKTKFKTSPTAITSPRQCQANQINAKAIPNARKTKLPNFIEPQLAKIADKTPTDAGWLSEIKFDGYRMQARLDQGHVALRSRNGIDWTSKLPSLVKEIEKISASTAIIDGEIVALNADQISDFSQLKNFLSEQRDEKLFYYLFDLLYLNGYDLRQCSQLDRKLTLESLLHTQQKQIRYSDHAQGLIEPMWERACSMHLEGIICKRIDAPYESGRSKNWIKVKCLGREEFVIIGFTEPQGSREGLGSLHMGYYDSEGTLHYAGGVGTGYRREVLKKLIVKLHKLQRQRKPEMVFHSNLTPKNVHWVAPRLIAEVKFSGWTEDKLLRHSVFLGLRDDKSPLDVRRDPPNQKIERTNKKSYALSKSNLMKLSPHASKLSKNLSNPTTANIIRLTHPDRVLWPDIGITKADLAEYWENIAPVALPHIAGRPLALVRCPEGRKKQCFFQKQATSGFPEAIKSHSIDGEKTIGIEDINGLIALAQIGVLEVHPWGATYENIEHPDRLTFDLDPDENLPFKRVVEAAKLVRDFLLELDLKSFCKTTGGKGLHVVVPLMPRLDWAKAKEFSKAIAQRLTELNPSNYTATISKQARKGRIFIDYLRNGRGATAIAALSPRNRLGAPISMPLRWSEVTPSLNPKNFNIRNAVQRYANRKDDPWQELAKLRQTIAPKYLRALGLRR